MTPEPDPDAIARAAYDAAYPLTDRPSWQDPNIRRTWREITQAALAPAGQVPARQAPGAPAGTVSQVLGATAEKAPTPAQPAATAPRQAADAPVRRDPGRPPTRKERYEPFSTKVSILCETASTRRSHESGAQTKS